MQVDKNDLPRPVFPENNKFFCSEFSKLSIKLWANLTIISIFFLGDKGEWYFSWFTSFEYKSKEKLLKLLEN